MMIEDQHKALEQLAETGDEVRRAIQLNTDMSILDEENIFHYSVERSRALERMAQMCGHLDSRECLAACLPDRV